MKKKSLLIRIFNCVYLALAAASIVSICVSPLVKVDLEASIGSDLLSSVFAEEENGDNGSGDIGGGTSSPIFFTKGDPAGDDDNSDILTKYLNDDTFKENGIDEIKLKITIDVPASVCFNFNDPKALQNYVFDREDGLIHNQIISALETEDTREEFKNMDIIDKFVGMIKSVAKNVAKDTITEQVQKQIENRIEEAMSDSSASQIFEEHGLGAQVDTLTENVFELFESEENVTVTQLMDTIMGSKEDGAGEATVFGILNELSEAGVEEFAGFDPESVDSNVIQEAMEEALSSIPGLTSTDEDGNLVITNIDDAILTLLDKFSDLTGGGDGEKEDKENADQTKEGEEGKKPAPMFVTKAKKIDDETHDKYLNKLVEKIEGFIPEDLWTTDLSLGGIMPYVLIGVLGFFALPWALFGLVTLIRTIRPKKCWTKPWIVFFFAFYQLILGVGLTIGLKVALPAIKDLIAGAMTEETSVVSSVIGGLNLSMQFSVLIPSIIYLVMIPLTIVYIVVCHGYKKEYKEEKKARKAEKKAA